MHRIMRWAGMGLLFSLGFGVAGTQAQQPVAAEPQASSQTVQTPRELVPALPVPRLVKFTGTLKDEQGKARTGVVGMTFAIYKDQEGGAALWLETQNAELDEQGRYTALLGATKNEGLPLELFASGEPRWLGVQVNLPREVEQPRVLLVSVPYALKASDADTVGGLPASAFVLTQPAAGSPGGAQTGSNPKVTNKTGAKSAASPSATISGSGTVNQVTKFTPDGSTIGNSAITEVNGNVGIGYTTPVTKLVVAVPMGGGVMNASNLADQDMFVTLTAPGASDKFAYFGPSTATNLTLGTGLVEKMRITNAGNVGIGWSNPQQRLVIAAPAGGGMLNLSNLLDQDMLVTLSAPGAADKTGYIGPGAPTNLVLGVGGAEKVRITNAGNVGIGTSTPSAKLTINNNISNLFPGVPGILVGNPSGTTAIWEGKDSAHFLEMAWLDPNFARISTGGGQPLTLQDLGGNVGIGTATPANTLEVKAGGTTLADAWTTRSSARLKTNIQPIIGALDKIEKLHGVSYDLKANGKHDIGLIAEEVAQVVPEIVAFEPNGKDAQGLDYARLTALLIEAVKQQQAQISEQQAAIRALHSEVELLRRQSER
jgi:hypothetical protein